MLTRLRYTCSTRLKWFENNLTFQHSHCFFVQFLFRKTLLDSGACENWCTYTTYIKLETDTLPNMHVISVNEAHFAQFAGLLLTSIISHLSNTTGIDNMGCETCISLIFAGTPNKKIQSKSRYLSMVTFVLRFDNINGNKAMDDCNFSSLPEWLVWIFNVIYKTGGLLKTISLLIAISESWNDKYELTS